ncbi:hypothetical protein OROMI_023938 [Orobanche minor]
MSLLMLNDAVGDKNFVVEGSFCMSKGEVKDHLYYQW